MMKMSFHDNPGATLGQVKQVRKSEQSSRGGKRNPSLSYDIDDDWDFWERQTKATSSVPPQKKKKPQMANLTFERDGSLHRLKQAGPVASGNTSVARKSFAITRKFVNKPREQKDTITVHTSTPLLERQAYREEQSQIYQGEVNLLSIIDTNKEMMCCKYVEDCREVATGFADGIIRVFDCSTGTCNHTLLDDECRQYPGPVTAIKHRPVSKSQAVSNLLLCSNVNGAIKCWKYKYNTCLYTIREKRQTLGLAYHPRFNKFITYGDDCKLNMYDEESQTQERFFHASGKPGVKDGHSSRIFACSFNPLSNHELISGGWDDSVMCWDDRVPFATRYFDGVHMCGEGLDFNKAGKQILTCAWQQQDSIQIWDYGSSKLIETITPDHLQSKLYCGRFVPETSMMVCGGSEANVIRLIDLNLKRTESSIRNNPGAIYAFDFGTVRRKAKKEQIAFKKANEMHLVPRVSFITGKRLQTVDFG